MSGLRIEDLLKEKVIATIQELFGEAANEGQIQIQKTRREFDGDLTVVVFPFVRLAKKSPEQTGALIGEYLVENVGEIVEFNTVKGFLNLSISESYWMEFILSSFTQENYGYSVPKSQPQVMVEYSSPNTNKPLHLGHLRNNFLGYSVAEILKAVGHDVIKVQIVNDRGIHICKSMLAWQKKGEGETPESSGIKGDHLVGKYYVKFNDLYKDDVAKLVAGGMDQKQAENEAPILQEARELLKKWEAKDPEVYALWEKMNSWVYEGFSSTYEEMGVNFDKLYYESNTYLKGKEEIDKGLEAGVFYKKDDGSVWCDLTKDGLDEKLVLRSDGTAVYMTQDIGTAILRFEDFPELDYQIYTVGNEQEYHFKVLFLILKKLGFDKSQMNHHLSYGMVELPSGKMKSREGTVVDADDLLHEMKSTAEEITEELGKLHDVNEEEKENLYKTIGHGALKYFLLKVDPKKNMMFDPQASIDFNGNTSSFIQYAYVRTRAILRKHGKALPTIANYEGELSDKEKDLVKKIHDFPAILGEAAVDYSPAIVANYTFELVKEFNSFYQQTPILKAENMDIINFRLRLCEKAGLVIKSAMVLLGIEMPERM